MYTYSVIAHIRKVLSALIVLADAENVPASHVISRHVFEWTAQACYISNKLKVCYDQKDWEKAWEILTPAAIGNLWANKFGAKYAPASGPAMPTAPNPVRIGKAITEYEAHQEKTYGYKEAKDTYGLLSEYASERNLFAAVPHNRSGWNADNRQQCVRLFTALCELVLDRPAPLW